MCWWCAHPKVSKPENRNIMYELCLHVHVWRCIILIVIIIAVVVGVAATLLLVVTKANTCPKLLCCCHMCGWHCGVLFYFMFTNLCLSVTIVDGAISVSRSLVECFSVYSRSLSQIAALKSLDRAKQESRKQLYRVQVSLSLHRVMTVGGVNCGNGFSASSTRTPTVLNLVWGYFSPQHEGNGRWLLVWEDDSA